MSFKLRILLFGVYCLLAALGGAISLGVLWVVSLRDVPIAEWGVPNMPVLSYVSLWIFVGMYLYFRKYGDKSKTYTPSDCTDIQGSENIEVETYE